MAKNQHFNYAVGFYNIAQNSLHIRTFLKMSCFRTTEAQHRQPVDAEGCHFFFIAS